MEVKGFVIDSTGAIRKMGNLIAEEMLGASERVYGEDKNITPMIPRSRWYDQSVSPYAVKWIKDQKNTSACNAFAIAKGIELARSDMTFGRNQIQLSPAPIYNAICGGVDEGSSLPAGMVEAAKGTCPSSYIDDTDWQLRNAKPGWQGLRSQFVVLERWKLPTFDHIASALLSNFKVIYGIPWYVGDDVDNRGRISESPQGDLAGGHALVAHALAMDGGLGTKGDNSWSEKWGWSGRLITPAKRFNDMYSGAWAIRATVIADGDLEGIPAI